MQDGTTECGLAAAAFAHKAERLTALDVEIDAVNRFDVCHSAREQAATDGEVHLQTPQAYECVACCRGWCRRFEQFCCHK